MGEVTDYIASLNGADREAIERVDARVRELVPDVTEGRSYGMPALLYRGKPLISALAKAKHLAVYPYSGTVVAAVADDLTDFSFSSGTIRFSADHPLPDRILTAVILRRRDEIDAKLAV